MEDIHKTMEISPFRLKLRIFFFHIKFRTTIPLKRIIRRFVVKKMTLNRPTSYPFITGDGFRALAQHILDEISDIDPKKVDSGDIVFVNADYLIDFFKRIHPHIQKKYILITHNSDLNITKEHIHYIDEKIIRWFAKNVLVQHDSIVPIPIGLVNTFCNTIGKTSDLPKVMRQHQEKNPCVSFGFSLLSGNERVYLHNLLTKHSFGVHISEKNQRTYFEKMNTSMFTASPEGNGVDCHRTWEALYLKTVPIVKKAFFVEYFKEMGLPLFIVNDWNELETLSEESLQNLYATHHNQFNHPALYMNYWIEKITKEKEVAYL